MSRVMRQRVSSATVPGSRKINNPVEGLPILVEYAAQQQQIVHRKRTIQRAQYIREYADAARGGNLPRGGVQTLCQMNPHQRLT